MIAKDRPRWPQDGPRWRQDGHKMAPRPPQDGPRWPQHGPRWPQVRPKTAQEGARMDPSHVLSRSYLHLLFGFLQIPAQSSSKTLPGSLRPPKTHPQDPQGPSRRPPGCSQEAPERLSQQSANALRVPFHLNSSFWIHLRSSRSPVGPMFAHVGPHFGPCRSIF